MTKNSIQDIGIAVANGLLPPQRDGARREIELALLEAIGPGNGVEIAANGQAFDNQGGTSNQTEVTTASVFSWLTDRQPGRVLAAKYPDLAAAVGG